jgi:ATP-dependent Lon protease
MSRDKQSKTAQMKKSLRSKKEEERSRRMKKSKVSDSDSDSNYETDCSENEEIDIQEYRKFLANMFPSKYMKKKVEDGEKDEIYSETSSEEEFKKKCKKTNKHKNKYESSQETEYTDDDDSWESESEIENNKKKNKKNKKTIESESNTVSESDSETLGSHDTEDDSISSDENEEEINKNKQSKLNIIFTIGGLKKNEDDWESDNDDTYNEDDIDSNEDTEDEDVSVSSDSSNNSEESDSEKSVSTIEEIKKNKNSKSKKDKKEKKLCKYDKIEEHSRDELLEKIKSNPENKDSNNEILAKLRELYEANKKDKSIQKCIEVYERDIKKQKLRTEKKEKKQKAKNLRIFRKIVRDKNTSNDFNFYEKLKLDEQKKIIKELREINKITRIEKPYRMTLLESNIPVQFKAAAMKKINTLRHMEPGSGEFYKIKNWVDTFMRIPFGKYEGLPISIDDGVDKCHEFMENAQKTLENAAYGLNDAKMQIMQMLGQLLTNPKAIGTAIAIHGPPGTGKTSIVKEGISKILNRPFAFIALGGATDSSFLEGHSYTYEGSTWGKILQILIDSKCMNPVIYFDELDKISDTPRGEEIAGILTHLTDTTQNSQFHDKYFAEINFDLSKCLFIFSYNDESKVNPILRDRMYRIKTKGYNQKEKTIITNDYLLPRIREQVKFKNEDIIIPDSTIHYIIENHCDKEDGVRNLKRCLEIIHTKLNLYRLMRPGSNLFEGDMSFKVEFPFTVTKDLVDKLIKKDKDSYSAISSMYV